MGQATQQCTVGDGVFCLSTPVCLPGRAFQRSNEANSEPAGYPGKGV